MLLSDKVSTIVWALGQYLVLLIQVLRLLQVSIGSAQFKGSIPYTTFELIKPNCTLYTKLLFFSVHQSSIARVCKRDKLKIWFKLSSFCCIYILTIINRQFCHLLKLIFNAYFTTDLPILEVREKEIPVVY